MRAKGCISESESVTRNGWEPQVGFPLESWAPVMEATAPPIITQDGTLVVKGENQTTLKQDPMRIQKTVSSGN